MSVAEAQVRIDSQEFAEWMAFDRIDGIGDERQDLCLAQIASLIFNANRAEGADAKAPIEFMPYADKPPEKQTPQQMWGIFERLAAVQNNQPNSES